VQKPTRISGKAFAPEGKIRNVMLSRRTPIKKRRSIKTVWRKNKLVITPLSWIEPKRHRPVKKSKDPKFLAALGGKVKRGHRGKKKCP